MRHEFASFLLCNFMSITVSPLMSRYERNFYGKLKQASVVSWCAFKDNCFNRRLEWLALWWRRPILSVCLLNCRPVSIWKVPVQFAETKELAAVSGTHNECGTIVLLQFIAAVERTAEHYMYSKVTDEAFIHESRLISLAWTEILPRNHIRILFQESLSLCLVWCLFTYFALQ